MKSLTQTTPLKTRIWNELKIMLPYNELKIMKGKALFPKNKLNEVKLCLIDIYKEFEEEIQDLFNWRA